MIYIIDANNLAGAFGLLGEDDFDKMVAARVKNYFSDSGNRAVLVFDSNDYFGDRALIDGMELIYAPRDDFYRGADNKIIEVAKKYLADESFKGEIRVVSDDLDLCFKVEDSIRENRQSRRAALEKSSAFAAKIEAAEARDISSETPDKEAAAAGAEEFNKELLKLWDKDKE